jgi:hypothetical protein
LVVTVGLAVGFVVSITVGVDVVGLAVGFDVSITVGVDVGVPVADDDGLVAVVLGATVCTTSVFDSVGICVGGSDVFVGCDVGCDVGSDVGWDVCVGCDVGSDVCVGSEDGCDDGKSLEMIVGDAV